MITSTVPNIEITQGQALRKDIPGFLIRLRGATFQKQKAHTEQKVPRLPKIHNINLPLA